MLFDKFQFGELIKSLQERKGALLYTARCSALRAELGSPREGAKGAACNCAICHNSTKKRSASAPIRSVRCLTKGPANRRGLFAVQRPCGGYERDETLPLTQLWAKLRGKAYRNKSKNQHILADTLVFVVITQHYRFLFLWVISCC